MNTIKWVLLAFLGFFVFGMVFSILLKVGVLLLIFMAILAMFQKVFK